MFSVSTEAARLRACCRYFNLTLKFSLACAVLGSLPALAQDASTTSPTATLPPVVVTYPPTAKAATKPEKPAPAAPSSNANGIGQTPVISPTTVSTPADQVASSITFITAADLEQDQRRTVSDALQTVPGLNIVQTGGPGGQTSIYMRGTNSNHVKVLVDGIDVSDPSNPNGSYDFGQLLTGDVERIEVLRGPQSGLYGSDAIGGVISIVTKKGDGPPQAYASAEAGSFGTFNQATGVSGSTPGFNYAFNIAHYHADDVPVTPLDLLAPGERRNNDSYDNMTYSTKLGVDVSKDVTVNFVARYTDATLHFTGTGDVTAGPDPLQSTQLVHQFATRGEAVWSLFDGQFKNYFGLAYTDDWSQFPSPYYPTSTYDGERIKYDWRGVTEVAPGQILLTGIERQTESMNLYPGSAQTGDSAAFVELQSQWDKRFFLVSNFRYDDNDSFGPHETWRVAPSFIVPGLDTKLKASYGTGFKAPTLYELYVNVPGFEVANPNLRPETSTGYDVGFEQPLFANRLQFGATYFHNDINDLINGTYIPNTFLYEYVNVGRATTYGAESFASFAVTPEFKIRADYTYTIARDDITGEELLRRPKNKASFTAAWKANERLTLSGTVNYVGSWEDIDRVTYTNITAPGYTTVNIAANYAATDRLTVFGRIDNLFNEHYEDPSGFLRPGFGVFAGLKVKVDAVRLAEELK
ncbi:MAG: TonB-dependent receptor domain-containing protein [Rhodomicrobium sp.]